jgi:hypothetical protein
MQADRDARTRERAYQIWETEGRVEGRHDDHWHRAQREIAEEEARSEQVRDPGHPASLPERGQHPTGAEPDAPPPRRAGRPGAATEPTSGPPKPENAATSSMPDKEPEDTGPASRGRRAASPKPRA